MLLVRAGALGDLLLCRRTIFALRRAGHRVVLLAPAAPAAALRGPGEGEVEQVLAWEAPELARLLGGEGGSPPPALLGYDRVVAYTRSGDVVRALAALRARLVPHDPSPPPDRHAADWLSEAVTDLVPCVPALPPSLEPLADERVRAEPVLEALGEGFLAVHPGSGSPAKNWPADRYRELVERLSPGRRFLLVEGPADAGACAALRPLGRALHADSLPLRVLGAVLARAGLFVGNDSGVAHLAAAFGAPSLVLFGPSDARSWRPIGRSVHTVSSPDRTMQGIELERVAAAAAAIRDSARAA